MSGIKLIAAERQRQIEKEGWSPEHDDQHANFELTRAAVFYACYAIPEDEGSFITQYKPPFRWWPWEWRWFKQKDEVSNLVRAGALIAAEIDRLERSTASNKVLQPSKSVPHLTKRAGDSPLAYCSHGCAPNECSSPGCVNEYKSASV